MLDCGDCAIVNVRIHRELRWRWNGSWNRGARHRGNVGNVDPSECRRHQEYQRHRECRPRQGCWKPRALSGMCGSGSSSIASSSTPTSTSPTTPGGAARTGIPLGSTEIGNLGVSSAAAVPTMSVSPTVGIVDRLRWYQPCPTVTSPPAVSSSHDKPFPCPTSSLRNVEHYGRLLK